MKNHTKYPALVTTILLSVALFAAPAHAASTDNPIQRESSSAELVVAAPTASIKFDRPSVTTIAKPAPAPAPVLVAETPAPASPEPVVSQTLPTTTPKTSVAVAPVAQLAPAVSASGKGASIAAAAYAQIGVHQDCTMLVTNALRSVGINFHDWPAGYMSLGTIVPASQAQPGDLAYYQNGGMGMAHIAVYVGNGQAIHGGWNGGTTALASVNVGSGPVFIRVA